MRLIADQIRCLPVEARLPAKVDAGEGDLVELAPTTTGKVESGSATCTCATESGIEVGDDGAAKDSVEVGHVLQEVRRVEKPVK